MAIYRLAILTGNTRRLSACTVHHTQTIKANSYRDAVTVAQRLNAVVIGWWSVDGGRNSECA